MAAPVHRRLANALVFSAASLEVTGCSSPGLSGAGASFPAAIDQRWLQELAGQGTRVNGQSVGSGAGARQFIAGTVDFAASDVPMKATEIAKVTRGVIQLPVTAGAVALAYNPKGCELKLNQGQLADIFLGKIRNFQPLGCAAKPIKVVFRSQQRCGHHGRAQLQERSRSPGLDRSRSRSHRQQSKPAGGLPDRDLLVGRALQGRHRHRPAGARQALQLRPLQSNPGECPRPRLCEPAGSNPVVACVGQFKTLSAYKTGAVIVLAARKWEHTTHP